jgi:CheY-like chemotaxis protein
MCSAVSPGSSADRSPRNAAVLCVDDSENMLVICRAILEASGYRVFTASDGEMGLDTLQHHAIDIAIVDNRMPGMTGPELAQEIKRIYHLPVLLFSDSGPVPAPSGSIDVFVNKKEGPRALCEAVGLLLARTAEHQ